MAILEALSILGSGASLFGLTSAIKSGKQINSILSNINEMNGKIEQLSNNIYLLDSLVVNDRNYLSHNQNTIHNYNNLLGDYESIASSLNSRILTSTIIQSPQKLIIGMQNNPRDLLFDIKPLGEISKYENENMFPIIFTKNNISYIGWQKKGMLSILFDCNYDPGKWHPNTVYDVFEKIGNVILNNLSHDERYGNNIIHKIYNRQCNYNFYSGLDNIVFKGSDLPSEIKELGIEENTNCNRVIGLLKNMNYSISDFSKPRKFRFEFDSDFAISFTGVKHTNAGKTIEVEFIYIHSKKALVLSHGEIMTVTIKIY